MIAAIKSGKYKPCAAISPTATWSAIPVISRRRDRRRGGRPVAGPRAQAGRSTGGVALITPTTAMPTKCSNWTRRPSCRPPTKDGSFKAKTAHTLNPVPLILYDNVSGGKLGLQQTKPAVCRASPPPSPTCSASRSTPSGTTACWISWLAVLADGRAASAASVGGSAQHGRRERV